MIKNVAIVGAGINGLLAAFLIAENYSDLPIDIYDAERHPSITDRHQGVTYGSRNARHVTGSESIGFESSIHKDALRNTPMHDIAGWLLKDETKLTFRDKQWREKFEATYTGSGVINDIDFAHAKLNYKGLAAWYDLIRKCPFISKHIINNSGVNVYFQNKTAFEDDLAMETEFCQRYFKSGQVKVAQNEKFNDLYSKMLVVPGLSIRVMSLAFEILDRLEKDKNVRLHWATIVRNGDELKSDIIVWTAGVTHVQPAEYLQHDVQGIVGCWVTIPNQDYNKPFKIATPAPSAYINFTPDGQSLHISGGFGWTGEHTDSLTVSKIARPIAKHFVEQINKYLRSNVSIEDVDYCVRPSTPTGQPLLLTKNTKGKINIYITGSAKSGTTHAPVLSEYVLEQINKSIA